MTASTNEHSTPEPTPTPTPTPSPKPIPTLTLRELERRLSSAKPPIVVEALPQAHYAAAHIPAAVNLPLDGLARRAHALLPDPDAEIVVYCSSPTCQNSHIAARALSALGYSRVSVFPGGKSEWKNAGNPLEVSP